MKKEPKLLKREPKNPIETKRNQKKSKRTKRNQKEPKGTKRNQTEPKRINKEPKGTKPNQIISVPFSYTDAVKFYRSVHSETQLETEIQELIYYHRKCGSSGLCREKTTNRGCQ